MKIKPVLHTAKPKYPDKYEVESDKSLLHYRPKSWLKTPLVGVALSAIMSAGLAGYSCGDDIGALGGDPVYVPPYHLSDTDALAVIADELARIRSVFLKSEKYGRRYQFVAGTHTDDFEFDAHLLDGDYTIGLEYVSKDDCTNEKFSGLMAYKSNCSPQSLAAELKAVYPDAAVFHDPNSDRPELDIRNQVIDFIEWLMSVGAEG